MEKPPFQFSLIDLLLIVTAFAIWFAAAKISGTIHAPPLFVRLLVFAGIARAVYQLVRQHRFGWAISILAAPIIALTVLDLAVVVSAFV